MIERIVVSEETTPKVKITSILGRVRMFLTRTVPYEEPETPKKRINKRDWKDWEIAFMKEEYPAMSVKDIAIRLNRPYGTVYDNMRKRGIIKRKE